MLLFCQPDAAWQHVIELAIARETKVERILNTVHHGGRNQQVWTATSYSRPGHLHYIDLDATATGVSFDCECEAHRDGSKPCSHVAMVLLTMGFLTAPAPDEPTPEPTPDLTALRGKVALSLLAGDDDYDALKAELVALESGH